jgi:hypothetical protein
MPMISSVMVWTLSPFVFIKNARKRRAIEIKQCIHLGVGFWFGYNSCMLALPMLSFSDFVPNSLALA